MFRQIKYQFEFTYIFTKLSKYFNFTKELHSYVNDCHWHNGIKKKKKNGAYAPLIEQCHPIHDELGIYQPLNFGAQHGV